MAQDKGENILTGPPMNPPPRSSPFGELHGCDGDGCVSARDTWPLYHWLRRGVPCRLCCSCIILSNRSVYCCRCFFLVSSPSCNYDIDDPVMAPPAPTVTCQVCREAVAHVPCLYPADGVFVCPPCVAAQNGTPFTYAPPCRRPLDERQGRILVLAGRMAVALLKRHETAARAAAERKAREALDAKAIAHAALAVAYDLGAAHDPSRVLPPSPENDLAASEEEGGEAEADMEVGEVRLMRRNTMALAAPLAALAIGPGGSASVVPLAQAEAKHKPTPSQSKRLFNLNENAAENMVAGNPEHKRQRALNSFDVKGVAMAAAEAARASRPPRPPTLQLFPGAKACSSTKRPRTLELFDNDDDDEMEM